MTPDEYGELEDALREAGIAMMSIGGVPYALLPNDNGDGWKTVRLEDLHGRQGRVSGG